MSLARAKYIRRIFTIVAVAFAIPLQWKLFTGFYIWLSPFVMLNSIFLLKSMVLLNTFGWAILVISFFKNRWFCHYMCPVGLGCDAFSKWGKTGNKTVQKIPQMGRWLAMISLGAALTGIPLFILLDPLAVFNAFFAAFTKEINFAAVLSLLGLPLLLVLQLFLPGIWCKKLCPLGGLFNEITSLRIGLTEKLRKEQGSLPKSAFGRRIFIASGTGLLAGIFIPKVLKPKAGSFFRPPGSAAENVFDLLCVRCGNCIKACPTNILKHHTGSVNLTAWMTPEVSFQNKGYCLEDCNLCGIVCPSGSISPFSIDAKNILFIGSIEIVLENCLLTELKECDRCKSVCHYDAIEVVPTGNSVIMKPVADLSVCVGCGACAAVCPTETIRMILRGRQAEFSYRFLDLNQTKH